MRNLFAVAAMMFAIAATASAGRASTLTADGVTYSLTYTSTANPLTDQFTLTITGINGASDSEGGRYGVQSFAFSPPSNFESAVAPTGFSEESGGLNSTGCDGSGSFFCFASTTPLGTSVLSADSSLTFVFDLTLSSGSFSGYDPSFKINWNGKKNNYNLVSEELQPTFAQATPLPPALILFAGGLALIVLTGRRTRRAAASSLSDQHATA